MRGRNSRIIRAGSPLSWIFWGLRPTTLEEGRARSTLPTILEKRRRRCVRALGLCVGCRRRWLSCFESQGGLEKSAHETCSRHERGAGTSRLGNVEGSPKCTAQKSVESAGTYIAPACFTMGHGEEGERKYHTRNQQYHRPRQSNHESAAKYSSSEGGRSSLVNTTTACLSWPMPRAMAD